LPQRRNQKTKKETKTPKKEKEKEMKKTLFPDRKMIGLIKSDIATYKIYERPKHGDYILQWKIDGNSDFQWYDDLIQIFDKMSTIESGDEFEEESFNSIDNSEIIGEEESF
jgi:hypothetical protein